MFEKTVIRINLNYNQNPEIFINFVVIYISKTLKSTLKWE